VRPLRLEAAPGGAGGHWKVYRDGAWLGWVHRVDYRHWQAKGPTGAALGAFPNRREAVEALDVEAGAVADADPAGLAAAWDRLLLAGPERPAGDGLRPEPAPGPVPGDAPGQPPDAGPGAVPDADASGAPDPAAAPYTHADMDSDRDLKQDTYRDEDTDAPAIADAVLGTANAIGESIPNIVLHPGDQLTLDPAADAGDDRYGAIRLYDRSGRCYAVLDCDISDSPAQWIIESIRYLPHPGERGVLPVRAQPEPVPLDGTISVVGPVDGPYAYALAHSHHHAHGTGDGDVLTHAHKHEHVGPEASRANQLGHTADVHQHKH